VICGQSGEVTPAASPPTAEGDEPPSIRGRSQAFGDFGAVAGSRALSLVLSIAAVAFATRVLGRGDYGLFAYATVVATLVLTVGSAWTSAAVLRYGRERLELDGNLVAVTWERLRVTAPGVVFITVVIAAVRAVGAFERISPELLAVALVYGVVLVVGDHLVYVAQAVGMMQSSAIAVGVRQGLVVAALAALLAMGTGTPELVIALTIVAWIVVVPFLAVPVWRTALWPPAGDPVVRRRILAFSVPLIAFTLSQYVIQSVDLVVIGVYRGTESVGVYGVAYQAYSLLQNLAAAAVPVLIGLFVSAAAIGRLDATTTFVARVVPFGAFASAALFGVAAPLVPLVLPVLLGDDFSGASVPLVILLASATLLMVASLLAPIVMLHEATRPVAWINLAAAAVNVAGDIVLIGLLGVGILAAAVATTASTLVIVAGYAAVVARTTGVFPAVRPLVVLPLVTGVALALALPAAIAAAVGVPAALGVAWAVLRHGGLVDASDIERLASVGMPPRLLRLLQSAAGES
jgi:O-antigen/teichoic acid export membrane protein